MLVSFWDKYSFLPDELLYDSERKRKRKRETVVIRRESVSP